MIQILKNIEWGDTVALIFFSFGIVIAIMALFVGVMMFFKFLFRTKNKEQRAKTVRNKVNVNINDYQDTKQYERDMAAIATVIHLYFNEIHDYESGIITIKRK